MGLGLGAFCVGCCWGFMALGFVGGVMSLLWMGLATFFMVIEKLPQVGHYVTKPMGAILIVSGAAVLLWTQLTGG
jgi:predicted metal-binding membrane protein